MNNNMSINLKKIISYTLALSIVVSSFSFVPLTVKAAGVPTITIGSQSALNGTAINVPVNASNFIDVGSIDFGVQYDTSLLTYTGHATTSFSGTFDNDSINLVGNTITISWPSQSVSLSDGEILTLKFTVISAATTNANLTVVGAKEIANVVGDVITSSFVDGSISLNPAATLSGIAITTPASKLTFNVGDSLDITGLVVTGTYSDDSTKIETITVDDISGFNSSAPATGQVLTITVGGKTTTYTIDIVVPLSSVKKITAFSFATPSVTGVITEADHTIAVTVPFGSAVTALTPTIVVSTGASVSPASGVAQNFTSPVTYTVTAEDSSTQSYVVTVTVAPNTAKDITSFNFAGLNPSVTGIITGTNITLDVPFGTNVTALIPTIAITGASVSPASGVAQNFTSPVTYTVTAADASTQDYTVTVIVAQPSDLTALTVAITTAQNKHDAAVEGNQTGQYPAPLKASLQTAINSASALTQATAQSVVDAAVVTLNAAIATFEAGVVPPDVEAPIITLLGENPITISFGENYTDASATALDDRDGNITANIVVVNPVNTSLVGTYTITYNVSDAEGNAAQQVTRTVHVVDVTAPVITLLGEVAITLVLGEAYNEPGYTATDNVDGDMHDQVVISTVNPVNVNVVGTYTISYRVSDVAGNTTEAKRKVKVLPVITAEKIVLAPEMTVDAIQHDVVVGTNDVGSAIVSVPADVTNARLDMTTLVEQIDVNKKSVALAGAITVNTATVTGTISIQIPAMTITASSDWNGMINTPQVKETSSVTLPLVEGRTAVPVTVVEVGAGDIPLTFTNAARFSIAGQAGKRGGYVRDELFTTITTTCSADTQEMGNALSAEGDCAMDVGNDLVIWTKHFTRFVSYFLSRGGWVVENPKSETVAVAFVEGATTSNRNVILALTYGSDINEVAVSNFSDFRGAALEPPFKSRNWVLGPEIGPQKVYVMFKNADGGMLAKDASITLTAPGAAVALPPASAVSSTPATIPQVSVVPSLPEPSLPSITPSVPRVLGVESVDIVALEKQRVASVDQKLAQKLKGRVLSLSESPADTWYLDPVSLQKFHITDDKTAFRALEKFGLGITNADLAKIPLGTDIAVKAGALSRRLLGRILLQVESHGEAWYVNPEDGKRYYVANGAEAYQLMQSLRKDIPPADFRKISVGDLG